MSWFSDIVEKQEQLDKEVRKFGQEKFKEALKEFFDMVPEVHVIAWTQYTPYFNDGEPCEFSVHEAGFFSKEDYDKCEEDDDFNDLYWADSALDIRIEEPGDWVYAQAKKHPEDSYYSDMIDDWGKATDRDKFVTTMCNKFSNLLLNAEKVLFITFGDHCTVKCTREEIEIGEAYHD